MQQFEKVSSPEMMEAVAEYKDGTVIAVNFARPNLEGPMELLTAAFAVAKSRYKSEVIGLSIIGAAPKEFSGIYRHPFSRGRLGKEDAAIRD